LVALAAIAVLVVEAGIVALVVIEQLAGVT